MRLCCCLTHMDLHVHRHPISTICMYFPGQATCHIMYNYHHTLLHLCSLPFHCHTCSLTEFHSVSSRETCTQTHFHMCIEMFIPTHTLAYIRFYTHTQPYTFCQRHNDVAGCSRQLAQQGQHLLPLAATTATARPPLSPQVTTGVSSPNCPSLVTPLHFLSLSLTHTRTHMHTHVHAHAHTHAYPHAHTCTHTCPARFSSH